jgi:MSHA biogenesis protein MshQ
MDGGRVLTYLGRGVRLVAGVLVCLVAAGSDALALRIGFHEAASSTDRDTSITVAVPAFTRAGDVMLAVVAARDAPSISADPAWTLLRTDVASGGDLRQSVYWRVASGGEPATYTWTLSSRERVAAQIVVYRGAAPTLPVSAGLTSVGSSSNIAAPSVASPGPDRTIVSFHGIARSTAISPPAGMSGRSEANTGSGGSGATILTADQSTTTGGATGVRTATASNSAANIGQTVLLEPMAAIPNPVAAYYFDEPAWTGAAGEVADATGNGLNGTALGGATTTAANAHLCRSGSFSGSPTRVDVPDNDRLDIRSTLTVTAWIRPATIPSGVDLMSFLSKDDNYEFHVASGGRLNWWWNGGGSRSVFTPTGTVSPDQWHFVAFVFTRGAQQIYVGRATSSTALVGTNADEEQLTPNGLKMQIGDDQDFGGGSRRWNGLIDEVRIYDQALTQSELESIRTATRPCGGGVASFQITVAPIASTCVGQVVTIRALDSVGNTLVSYVGIVNLSTSTGRGRWLASGTSGPVTENGSLEDGVASYEFRPADAGQATLFLANQSADNLTIAAVDNVNTSSFGMSGVVAFRDNAFVITPIDALATVPVAGRPHAMQVALWRRDTTQSPANCAVATNYAGLRNLKAWYVPDASHPPGATTPTVGAAALPAAPPAANNLALAFAGGVATFALGTADVGKYALALRDDSRSFASGVDIDGSSPVLTVRPFALAITGVQRGGTLNPGGTATAGGAFAAAGESFAATVGAYLWNAAADANNDGVPDGAGSNVIAGGLAPRFSWPTTLSAGSTASARFSPAGGGLGALTRVGGGSLTLSGFRGGATTVGDLRYSEVGSIALTATLTGFLNSAGADLTGTAVNASGQSVPVGRFHPAGFALVPGAVPVSPFCGTSAAGFTYMGQPALGLDFTIEARNAQGTVTGNYRSGVYNVGTVTYVAENADDGNNLGSRLGGIPAVDWTGGVYTVTTANAVFARPAAGPIPDGPFESLLLGVIVDDPDGARLAGRDMNAAAAGCGGGCTAKAITALPTRVRFGRLRVGNALGSPLLPLPVPLTLEYWNGAGFVTNGQDSCTRLANTSFAFSAPTGGITLCNTSGTPAGANAIVFGGGRASNFRLSAPGNVAGGSVDLTLNLGVAATGNTCTGGAVAAATASAKPWLQGNWGAAAYDRNPRARASFGRYTTTPDVIYIRENY